MRTIMVLIVAFVALVLCVGCHQQKSTAEQEVVRIMDDIAQVKPLENALILDYRDRVVSMGDDAVYPLIKQLHNETPINWHYVGQAWLTYDDAAGLSDPTDPVPVKQATIADAASACLIRITGANFGYASHLDVKEKEEAIRKWHTWYVTTRF